MFARGFSIWTQTFNRRRPKIYVIEIACVSDDLKGRMKVPQSERVEYVIGFVNGLLMPNIVDYIDNFGRKTYLEIQRSSIE